MMTNENCIDISRSLNAYIDGELPDSERQAVSSHLQLCRSCRDEYDQLMQVNSLLSTIIAPECPGTIQDRLRNIPANNRQSLFIFRPLHYLKPLPVAASVLLTIFAALFLGTNLTNRTEATVSSDEQSFAQESLYTVWQEINYEE